jgi:hypothetical protein
MHECPHLIRLSRNYSKRLAVMLAGLWLGVGLPARADVGACILEHSTGQREAKAGHLKQASELFASCAAMQDCPDPIRAECSEFHRDTEKNIPTVIFSVVDAHGKDLSDVRVFAEQELLTDALDGRATQLDPGKHEFRFELAQGEQFTTAVLIREGEKNRVVSVRVPEKQSVPAQPQPGLAGAETTRNALPVGFWIAAGIGAAALTSWGVFALSGHSLQSKLDECSPNCNASRHGDFDAMRRDYLIADLSLGVGIASAGVATWFVLSQPASTARAKQQRGQNAPQLTLLPVASVSGSWLLLSTTRF